MNGSGLNGKNVTFAYAIKTASFMKSIIKEETMMNAHKMYFIQQKLIGVALLMIAILSIVVLKDATVAIAAVPGGLMFIFSKKMIFAESYFDKMHDEKEGSH